MRSLPFTKLATGGLTAVLALLLLFVPGALAEDRSVETTADDSAQVDDARPRKPKIRCHGALTFGAKPVVKCRWTEATHPDAAGYKIVRVGGGERTVVHRTDDLGATRFNDKDVAWGTRYRYRVVVVDDAGKRLQRSRWNKAIVRKPDIERLRMDCDITETDTPETDTPETGAAQPDAAGTPVLCEWRAAESDEVTEYQLWRRVRGQHRELVATVSAETLSQPDTVPADASKVVYAVLALDADGDIIGRSGLSKLLLGANA